MFYPNTLESHQICMRHHNDTKDRTEVAFSTTVSFHNSSDASKVERIHKSGSRWRVYCVLLECVDAAATRDSVAPAKSNCCTISACPPAVAMSKGERPSSVHAFTSQPAAKSSCRHPLWPLNAAAHIADAPLFGPDVNVFETSPPAARSALRTTACPYCEDI